MDIPTINTILTRLAKALGLSYPRLQVTPEAKVRYLKTNGPSALAPLFAEAERTMSPVSRLGRGVAPGPAPTAVFLYGVVRALEAQGGLR